MYDSLGTGYHTLRNAYFPLSVLIHSPGKILIGSALGHLSPPWPGAGPGRRVLGASSGCLGVQGPALTRVPWNGGRAVSRGAGSFE